MKKLLPLFALIASIASASQAFASSKYEGMAQPWQLGLQAPATPVMEKLYGLHDILLIIISVIVVVVMVLMAYIMIRFRRKANPNPSKTTHNTQLEIIWTTIPIIILVCIAIPSLRYHFYMQETPTPELTVKVVGYQWYWHYDYPADTNSGAGFGFDSYMKKGADLKPEDHRQLSVDNRLVVPVDTNVRVLITGADVIHSWAVPAFGVKRDAVPGRLNETWFRATKIGTFYGQCSQLCGVGHGFMPVVVDVVSKEDFNSWVASEQKKAGVSAATGTTTATAKPDAATKTNKK